MAATAEATREELVAEYVARHAVMVVENRIGSPLDGEDEDVLAKLADREERLVRDGRYEALFLELWPRDFVKKDTSFLDRLYLAPTSRTEAREKHERSCGTDTRRTYTRRATRAAEKVG